MISLCTAPAGLVGAPLLSPHVATQRPSSFSLLPQFQSRSKLLASALPPKGSLIQPIANDALRVEALGEVLGTCVLMLIGFGVACSALLAPVSLAHVAAVWGGAVVLGIGVASKLSDAHLNPAVTFAMVLHRGFSVRRAVVYVAAQLAGALVAALIVAIAFLPQVQAHGHWLPFQLAFCPASPEACAAGTFAARSLVTCAHEGWATGLLVFLVMHLDDGPLKPATIGGAVALLISVAGPLTGAGLNPARDLGPRLAAALLRLVYAPGLAGAGLAQAGAYVVGPLVGGALGGALSSWVERVRGRGASALAGSNAD